ncbi:MAG: TonB-dependent receptor [Gemmatimonadetes bacterium]|nr:MAG: TonB-dependent receptor [Gemmatimonadota bacterium]
MRRPALALILLSVALARAEEPRPGRIVGRVRVAGPPPAPRPPIDAIIDATVCGPEIPDESLLVDHDGGVAHAVVVVRGVKAGAPTERLAVIVDNAHCRFVPRVQVVTRGQGVRVRSSDPVLHNAHPVLVAAPEVSIANLALAVPGQTMDLTRRLAATLPARGEALVRLACDVHPWMRGWLVVLDHPYAAVTGADGTFTIPEVPPGSYTLALWHETLGRTERRVTVPPGATVSIDFTLPPPGR